MTRRLTGAALLILLAGCQMLPPRPGPEPEPPPYRPPPVAAPEPTPARLVDAMDRLQNGDFDGAANLLERLREASPGSPTLALLLRQLETDPAELLPGPYRTIRVEAGDTLSELAERELGNPLLFVALARLNALDVPRQLPVGFDLRVPQAVRREEGPEPEAPVVATTTADAAAPTAPPEVERRSELETVAEYLLASGQPTDARELLLASARDGQLTPHAEELLVELTLDSARAEADAGQFDVAVATLDQAAAALPPGPLRARLEVRRTRIEVRSRLDRADALEQRGLLYEAYALAEQALLLDPDYAPALEREAILREALITNYHDRALRAWRARDIDLAIRTWQALLDVVPEFEPARVYLERAQRLRTRLAEPD